MKRAFLFGLISILLIFAIMETLLRIAGINPRVDNPFFMLVRVYEYPEYFKKDHNLFWRFRENIKGGAKFLVPGSYRINSIGLRGADKAVDTSSQTMRIACFGNSCTFGWRLEESQTYPMILEELLTRDVLPAKAGIQTSADSAMQNRFQVFNCGIPGYSSFQGLRMMREYLPILKPHYVTICYGWNDHWAASFDIEDKNQEMPPQILLDVQNIMSESYVYRGLKYTLLSRSEKSREYTYDRESPKYRVSVQDFRNNLIEMIALCRSQNISPILITAPVGDADPGIENSMEIYHELYAEVVRQVAIEEEVSLVDAAATFKRHPEFFSDAEIDFIHYNATGARFISEAVSNLISSGF